MALVLLVKSPDKLRRTDGTAIAIFDQISLTDSLKITKGLLTDWRILMLLPCTLSCRRVPSSRCQADDRTGFFTPEVFFPFQASLNAYAFNLRTRVLNSLLNNLIQIPTVLGLGFLLDNEKLGTRRRRAMIGITIDAVWITGEQSDRSTQVR